MRDPEIHRQNQAEAPREKTEAGKESQLAKVARHLAFFLPTTAIAIGVNIGVTYAFHLQGCDAWWLSAALGLPCGMACGWAGARLNDRYERWRRDRKRRRLLEELMDEWTRGHHLSCPWYSGGACLCKPPEEGGGSKKDGGAPSPKKWV